MQITFWYLSTQKRFQPKIDFKKIEFERVVPNIRESSSSEICYSKSLFYTIILLNLMELDESIFQVDVFELQKTLDEIPVFSLPYLLPYSNILLLIHPAIISIMNARYPKIIPITNSPNAKYS